MKTVTLVGFTLATLAFAGSNTFHATFDHNAWIGTSEVKAGNYKIQIVGNQAILKSGKKTIEAPAKIENANHKFKANAVVVKTIDNKQKVQEIQIGGTNQRIVFSAPASPSGD